MPPRTVKLSIVAHHLPDPEGTATGRVLHAVGTGLLAEGHDVEVWSWTPRPPRAAPPSWCDWRPLPSEHEVRTRLRALVRPRSDIVRAGWRPPDDAVALADEPVSFPAIAGSDRSVLMLHYLAVLDATGLERREARDLQSRRAEHTFPRQARAVLAYSGRVARNASVPATVIPMPFGIPPQPVPFVEEPVAALLADWEWPPNHAALRHLLQAWPEVLNRVPGARLLLAGRHLDEMQVGSLPGVETIGPVDRTEDLLSRAAVLAFPCPDTSGPKVKVVEALSYGLPVVTTPAGIEGIGIGPDRGAVVTGRSGFAAALAAALADPGRRAELGRTGREDVSATHAPVPAARARVEAIQRALNLPV